MQMSDVIADMLTRIRNASNAKHATVDIPASNMKKSIADILVAEGYVNGGVRNIDMNDIPFPDEGDVSAVCRLGAHVSDGGAAAGTREASVGDQRHRLI